MFYIAADGKGKRTSDENKADGPKCSGASSFTFRELATATRGFREVNLIGEGGFGKVYKGRLETGQASSATCYNISELL